MNRKDILKNISDSDERLIVAKAMDKLQIALKTFTPEFTIFMDPYKAYSIKDMLLNNECKIIAYGGYEGCERLKLGFFPEFTECNFLQFPIVPIEISYNSVFGRTLTHRDFLGSILGLGITREKTGDIVIEENRAVAFVDSDIADYVVVNLDRVGRTKVRVKILDNYTPKLKEAVEKRLTVASLRIDALLSGALNLSRGKVADLIKGEKAYINWKKVTSVSHSVCENDVITLRGVGRVKINEVMGTTKKDRILISVSVFK